MAKTFEHYGKNIWTSS